MLAFLLCVEELSLYSVRDSNPILRAGDAQLHLRFQIGLVEAWEDSKAMKHFKL